ncbi:glycine cleavage system protein GcvH [Synechococcus sp. MIT S9508]|uniref:glycine cleavage system protein GcvH n=1 Tax=Synechococcus sp. MIT S9508 TaxID=1801629 RepID=UPI0007BC6CDA|nr:glycine cleavage system protein GcvH [Synechococcus sp. MIT S9508]KZR86478.1 Glycine cleavage system H protein [Synechococcus sp. MIT S9508]
MAFDFPASYRYADSHEYAWQDADSIRIGLSAYAVDQLGDIVFVDLPEVGSDLSRGSSFGTVESVKAVEEMYAPLSGEVVQRNEALLANPEELQKDPHGEGWLLVIRPSDETQLEQLMDAATYSAKVAAT